ncbi:hypothetical protein, partial [Streptomyces vinaceus]|uniref:hypothetical protein n=1 Tax=Streptomyces vinaceus TaxID=1960 RepID=UPI0038245EE3
AASLISASVTFALVIGASSMIGSYTERFTVPTTEYETEPFLLQSLTVTRPEFPIAVVWPRQGQAGVGREGE